MTYLSTSQYKYSYSPCGFSKKIEKMKMGFGSFPCIIYAYCSSHVVSNVVNSGAILQRKLARKWQWSHPLVLHVFPIPLLFSTCIVQNIYEVCAGWLGRDIANSAKIGYWHLKCWWRTEPQVPQGNVEFGGELGRLPLTGALIASFPGNDSTHVDAHSFCELLVVPLEAVPRPRDDFRRNKCLSHLACLSTARGGVRPVRRTSA